MSIAVETTVSTRRVTKEHVRVNQQLPEQLLEKAEPLIQLLKDYYSYMNEQGAPSNEFASITNARDIDQADEAYLDLIQKEIARTLPKATLSDRVKLYKSMMQYYSVRGSQDSIELFFKILFGDNVEVYYPMRDVLIPSSGNWDRTAVTPAYLDNRGFLSDRIKLQDSYFYQQFSYVIRTGNNVSTWSDAFNRLVHPAGFVFFGEILIVINLINSFTIPFESDTPENPESIEIKKARDAERIASSMPGQQLGYLGAEDYSLTIIIDPIGGTDNPARKIYYDQVDSVTAVLAENLYFSTIYIPLGTAGGHQIKYYDQGAINLYKDLVIEDAAAGDYMWDDFAVSDFTVDITTASSSGTNGTSFSVGETVEIRSIDDDAVIGTGTVVSFSNPTLKILKVYGSTSDGSYIEGLTSGAIRVIDSHINNLQTWNDVSLGITQVEPS